MSAPLSLEMPEPIRAEAQAQAAAEGVSLEEFVVSLVAERLEARRAFAAMEKDASQSDWNAWERYLAAIPDAEPIETDRLPDGWKPLH